MGLERPSGGGNSRTVSSVPVPLNRLYCLVISSSIVMNLGGGVFTSSSSLSFNEDNLRFIINLQRQFIHARAIMKNLLLLNTQNITTMKHKSTDLPIMGCDFCLQMTTADLRILVILCHHVYMLVLMSLFFLDKTLLCHAPSYLRPSTNIKGEHFLLVSSLSV
jgi:hypothetical protein